MSMPMEYAVASQIVQNYTGQPLLESLQLLRDRMEGGDDPIIKKEVRVAYYTLMAGFTELML